jgi:hypothetical protein
MRYWWHDGHLWATSWLPISTIHSPLIVIEVDRYLAWVEGTGVWDRLSDV